MAVLHRFNCITNCFCINSHESGSTPTGMNQKLPPLSLFSALIVGGAHSGWSLAGIFMKES